jgi:MFS family permease
VDIYIRILPLGCFLCAFEFENMEAWKTVYLLVSLSGVCVLLQMQPLLALMKRKYDTETQLVQGLQLAALNVVTFFVAPYFGRLSDSYGRKIPLLVVSACPPLVLILLGWFEEIGITTLIAIGGIMGGLSSCIISLVSAFIVDNVEDEDKLKYLGYLYAAFEVGVLGGAALGLLVDSWHNVRGAYNVENLKSHCVLVSWIGAGIMLVMVITACLLPAAKFQTVVGSGAERMSLVKSISYLCAQPNDIIRAVGTLNIVRVAAFQPIAGNFLPYLQLRFKDIHPHIYTIVLAYGLASALGLLCLSWFKRRWPVKKIMICGFFCLGALDFAVGLTSRSTYVLFFAWSVFCFFGVMINPSLDTLASNYSNDEDQGVVFGAMAQARSLAAIVLPLPLGFLFTAFDNLSKEERGSDEGMDVWYQGFPFVPFVLVGMLGAYWSSTLDLLHERSLSNTEYIAFEDAQNLDFGHQVGFEMADRDEKRSSISL